MDFGLNLILTFTDNATSQLSGVISSIENVGTVTNSMDRSLKNIEGMASLTSLAISAQQTGHMFVEMGKNVGSTLTGLVQRVINVGSEFEGFKITLEQLYGSAKEADNQLNKLLQFSATTPFEVDDVKDLVVVLKSQGLEAFKNIKGEVTETKQQTLAWLGDLMAFKPDIPASRWRLAFTNYLGSGAPKVLQNILDMGSIEGVVGHAIGDTAEERLNTLVEFIEKKDLGGLMSKMFGTWQQTISNLDDTFTMLYKDIADTGAFDNFKIALNNVAGALIELDKTGKLVSLAKMTGKALDPIAKFAIKVTDIIKNLIIELVDFANTHPTLVKTTILLMSLFSAITVGVGTALVALSKFAFMVNTIREFASVSGVLTSVGLNFLSLAKVIGLAWVIWHTNLFGIQDMVFDFVSGIIDAWNVAKDATSQSAEDMMKIYNNLDKGTFMGALTAGLMRVIVFVQALSDAWSDGEMDAELYQKAVDLGVIDLVSRILDLKYRIEAFVAGFKQGWKEMNDTVAEFVKNTMKKLEGTWLGDALDSIIDGLTNFFSMITSADIDKWEDFGKTMGNIAPFVVALAGAFLMFRGLKKVFSPITKLVKGGNKAESVLGGMAQGASNFTKSAVGLGIAAAGLWLLADASIKLANAGPEAVAMFVVMGATLAGLLVLASKIGKDLDEASAGMIAFGASIVMVAGGFALMALAATSLSNSGIGAMIMFGVMVGTIIALVAIIGNMGSTLATATPAMLAFGASLIMVGIGMNLFVIAATSLASAGGIAMGVMVGMIVVVALLAVMFAALGAPLAIAAPGMLAFGAALLMVGAAVLLASTGMTMLAGVLPQIAEYGLSASVSIYALGVSMSVFGAGALIAGAGALSAGAGLLVFGAGAVVASAGAVPLATALGLVTAEMDSISSDAISASSALTSMVSSVSLVEQGLNTLGKLVDSAAEALANLFSDVPDYSSPAQEISNSLGIVTTSANNLVSATGSMKGQLKGVLTTMVLLNTVSLSVANAINQINLRLMQMGSNASSSMTSQVASNFVRLSLSVSGAMNSAVEVVRNGVAKMQSAMNFSWSLPHLKLPHITVNGNFNIDPPTAPKFDVNWYAKGGVIDTPSVIGVGENGAEAVMPLENNTGWINTLANSITNNMSSGFVAQATPITQPQNVGYSDEYGGSEVSTITNNNGATSTTDARNIDNSVTFGEGSIVIQISGDGGDIDIHSLAVRLMNEIARLKQKQKTLDYGIDFAAGGV